MLDAITTFKKPNDFLSNFYFSPFIYKNLSWGTVENFYQAYKSLDSEAREKIRLCPSPGKAKRMGQKIKLRPDWETPDPIQIPVKIYVMRIGLRQKFTQNKSLAQKLLDTYPAYLIEGNHWHDNFWGSCECSKCIHIPGLNHLGREIMLLRSELFIGLV